MSKTKKISKSTRAKHVFGELTLKDFWPLMEGKFDLLQIALGLNSDYYYHFRFDDDQGLVVYGDEHYNDEIFELAPDCKVKACEDYIEVTEENGDQHEIRFIKAQTVKVDIL